MATITQNAMKEYDKLVKELDVILEEKRVSYAQFAIKQGIRTVSFYNKYKLYGFLLEDMNLFLAYAKKMPPNMIKCIKCSNEFIPTAKSVKRALCGQCREELRKKNSANDSIKFKYPSWVRAVGNVEIRRLVEQEFHIDEEIAFELSKAANIEDAKSIRADCWQSAYSNRNSLITLMNIK